MASGDTLMLWNAASNRPPASAAATLDTVNQHWILDFAAATDESAIFSGVIPQHYAATTGFTVRLGYTMSSATSGDVIWDVSFEALADGADVTADSFDAVQSATITVPGTAGLLDVGSIAFTEAGTQADGVAAGDMFRLKVTRDADNVSDTATGDAELHWVELQET